MLETTPLKPQLNFSKTQCQFSQCGKAIKVFGRVARFFLYKQASLTQATRKASK
ncbi:hypothetical protein NP0149_12340 [Helicobacter pylori]